MRARIRRTRTALLFAALALPAAGGLMAQTTSQTTIVVEGERLPDMADMTKGP